MLRSRIKARLGLLVVLCVTGIFNAPPARATDERPEPRRPHVLVIHADQHRGDCIGAYGNPDIKTPHLDALAAAGVRFANSFCAFPVCTPSRYSLLCGLPVHEHRGWDNRSTLASGTPTFPLLLRQAGYTTKAVGKMHLTPTYLDVGFDELELAEQDGPGRWDDDYHRDLRRAGIVDANDLEDQRAEYRKDARAAYWDTFGALPSNLSEANHSTTWIAQRAVAALEEWDAAKPALLMVGFIKPHHPFDPPLPWASMYKPESVSILPGWTPENLACDLALNKGYFPHAKLTEAALRRCMALYYASISQIDHHIGRMIQVLRAKGLYEDTLIVFTSDHGEFLGFHHMLLKGNHMYDPLAKVPLIIKLPGRAGGSVRDTLANTIDLAPTILKAAGLQVPDGMKGIDLSDPKSSRDIVFCETRQHVMARTQVRKLLYDVRTPDRSLFFNLQSDPLELRDLYHDPASRAEIESLVRAIKVWRPTPLAETYVNEQARQIDRPNVPPPGVSHREAISDWYSRQMQRWRDERP